MVLLSSPVKVAATADAGLSVPSTINTELLWQNNVPFEQRVSGPRAARRMNQGFQYFYRHENHHNSSTCFLDNHKINNPQNMSSWEWLSQFYSEERIREMNASFPPLLNLSVSRHLAPKLRFLTHTMGCCSTDDLQLDQVTIPPQYFGARLERIIAPRHAFLVHHNLPNGPDLLRNAQQWQEFLVACRTTKRFAVLCNSWGKQQKQTGNGMEASSITYKQIEAFDAVFGRGILAASRNELIHQNNPWPLAHINITSRQLIRLLIQHGANPLETDNRGASLLHWAAGTGNLEAVQELLPYFPHGVCESTQRDGSTPLHWAAAGANSKEFGVGGHPEVCRYLLSQCTAPTPANSECPSSTVSVSPKDMVNQVTFDGNSPLMWAAWSGTLETVKLMVRTRADPTVANRNGCTAAHWAASGGNLQVCQYLAKYSDVDFFQPNHGGNTPLSHAVAFGHEDIVRWLCDEQQERNHYNGDFDDYQTTQDDTAASLARDFVMWTKGDAKRKQILQVLTRDPN